MDFIRREYTSRVEEIELMIDFIRGLSSEDGDVFLRRIEFFEEVIQDSIKHILYSATLVMIYNLVESVAIASVEHIYDHLKDSLVSYDDLNSNFQKKIFKDFKGKKINSTNFVN